MIRSVSIAAIAIAGLVHIGIAPSQLAHAPAHGIFFGLAGVAQVAWALAFWRVRSSELTWTGMAVSGGLIVLWVSTRLMPAPFEPMPHAIDWSLMVTKVAEFIGFIALVGYGVRTPMLRLRWAAAPTVATAALGIAIVVGGGFWGIGHVGDVVFPYLGHDDAHQSDLIHSDEVGDASIQQMGPMAELASLLSTMEADREVDHRPAGESDLDDVDHHNAAMASAGEPKLAMD